MNALLLALLVGTAAAAPLPRTVLVLYRQGHVPGDVKDTFFLPAHQRVEMPLNWLGLDAEYVDVDRGLPRWEDRRDVRGVVAWLPAAHAFADPRPVCRWLERGLRSGVKAVLFGTLGFHRKGASGDPDLDPECVAMLAALGVDYRGLQAVDPMDVRISTYDARFLGFERKPDLSESLSLPLVKLLPGATALVSLELGALRDSVSAPAAVTRSGGVALTPFNLYANDSLVPTRFAWVLNPFAFLSAALDLKGWPRPDTTTLNGRRVYASHVDGDGFFNVSELDRRKFSGEVYLERFLEKRPDSPVSVSLIAGYYDLDLYKDADSLALSRRALGGPNIEPAVHGYSHPLVWRTGVPAIKIPRYTVNAAMETAGAARILGERILRSAAPPSLFFWTGDCLPRAEDLRAARDAGLLAVNGGGGRFDAAHPSYAYLLPLSRRVGGERQFYAPANNENEFTNMWSGPYYGYRDVVTTFERAGAPRRVKPVNVYVHFYSAERYASVSALDKAFDWAHAQPLIPVFMGRYVESVRDFFAMTMERSSSSRFRFSGGAMVRTVRFDDPVGEPDLAASKGVLGFKRELGSLYVHLDDGPERELVMSARPPRRPHLVEANFEVSGWEPRADGLRFLKRGWWVSEAVLGGFVPGRRYKVTGAGLDSALTAEPGGTLPLRFPDSEGAGPAREVVVSPI
jgi:hypothetical protein